MYKRNDTEKYNVHYMRGKQFSYAATLYAFCPRNYNFFFRFALCCRFVCFVQSSISKRQMSEHKQKHKHGWLVVATYSKMIKLPTIFTKEQPQANSNLYRQLASGQPSINRVSQTIEGFIVGSPLSPLANKELCTVKTL